MDVFLRVKAGAVEKEWGDGSCLLHGWLGKSKICMPGGQIREQVGSDAQCSLDLDKKQYRQ